MPVIRIKKHRSEEARFLHLLDLANLRLIFSRDKRGVKVEVCETKKGPPYAATFKFSFYVNDKEYAKITKKHSRIIGRMVRDLESLSRTIEELYRRKRNGR